MRPLLPTIVGPTASGKTAVSVVLAERGGVTVISADSRQIYRGFDIGTSKPSRDVLDRIPHRFIDLLEPHEEYSAGRYEHDAVESVADVFRSGGVPIVVGGTGLYVRALLYGLFRGPGKDERLRKELEERLAEEGEAALREELRRVDPRSAEGIEKGKPRRVIRALEVFSLTGKGMSEHHRALRPERSFRPLMVGLEVPRPELCARIDARVEAMMKRGLIEEVRSLLSGGVRPNAQAFNTVGYKEVLMHLHGEIPEGEMVRLIQRNTRRYAKRQMTWFRGEKDIEWVDASPVRSASDIAADIQERIERARKP